MNASDHKSWRFCPLDGLALVESKLLAKDLDGSVSFQVGCKNGHSLVLSEDPHRRQVTLHGWAQEGAR